LKPVLHLPETRQLMKKEDKNEYIGLLDLSGIQEFVFRSHRLREIAEASERIESLANSDNGLFARAAEDTGVELLMAAGGNAAFLSADPEKISAVFERVSRMLLKQGEGLQVVCHRHKRESDVPLPVAYRAAQKELDRKKTPPRATPDSRSAA
jgi:hypothetical protein